MYVQTVPGTGRTQKSCIAPPPRPTISFLDAARTAFHYLRWCSSEAPAPAPPPHRPTLARGISLTPLLPTLSQEPQDQEAGPPADLGLEKVEPPLSTVDESSPDKPINEGSGEYLAQPVLTHAYEFGPQVEKLECTETSIGKLNDTKGQYKLYWKCFSEYLNSLRKSVSNVCSKHLQNLNKGVLDRAVELLEFDSLESKARGIDLLAKYEKQHIGKRENHPLSSDSKQRERAIDIIKENQDMFHALGSNTLHALQSLGISIDPDDLNRARKLDQYSQTIHKIINDLYGALRFQQLHSVQLTFSHECRKVELTLSDECRKKVEELEQHSMLEHHEGMTAIMEKVLAKGEDSRPPLEAV